MPERARAERIAPQEGRRSPEASRWRTVELIPMRRPCRYAKLQYRRDIGHPDPDQHLRVTLFLCTERIGGSEERVCEPLYDTLTMGELAYRCLDCGAEFDGSGARIDP